MNIVCFGAHPDDCEVFAGGAASLWTAAGHQVHFVSMTNGDAGHYEQAGATLARRRAAEAQLAAEHAGIHCRILDHHDGELLPNLEARKAVIRIIRECQADLVLTHRPNDYHPDHRYTSLLVQDAAYMVLVPNLCPDVPALERNPTFLYMMDSFQRPVPFRPDVVVDVTAAQSLKYDMLATHESQFFEWLPWMDRQLTDVPIDRDKRRQWLEVRWEPFFKEPARRFTKALPRWYGPRQRKKIAYIEAFEVCEYGHQPSHSEILRLFPFLPKKRV